MLEKDQQEHQQRLGSDRPPHVAVTRQKPEDQQDRSTRDEKAVSPASAIVESRSADHQLRRRGLDAGISRSQKC